MALKLELENIDISLLNSIRRISSSEINTLQIDKVEIIENNTSFQDEFLAHRLSLIPLLIKNVNEYNEDCDCNNDCEKCSKVLNLDIICTDKTLNIKSDNFDENIVLKNILICKIERGESLKLRAIAKKNKGLNHIKWSPVSRVGFTQQENKTNFFIESNGVFEPKDILLSSIERIREQLNYIEKQLK